ncbi:MAG TPA: asparagine synthase (glutamine-hydrolyzing) [Bacteroidales bacterium]|nr:MAG: asparagine synthase (glutamine-hydrolyzing) [Bacteroidetes bacterium GWF2_33_38]OFY75872.1 MAG: asparagine synthase (glutamine-hydrolyzing) [Bacteroidetes bacterium RIFOXYA12_FULL_33_9]OFY92234.1 MAG: asparagine synthase (glutamine-hydrolyzing) [Bacteroidetes bacterium RIFOXYA2_FULL_33_7]HBF87397.1 asparagine synthase (glutamine-hydrolyzing) [Bacteroidales bacterium]
MCGIAGFYSKNNLFSKDELINMTNVIAHRGPDADGHFVDNFVGLGHRRLSIIDLSSQANMPMFSASNKHAIVYNGEVYNFKEIAQSLNINLKTTSDTEVILEAFEQWGVEFVNKLNGMFAIAIYNIENKELFLFRDRIGIKPLFYFWDGENFAFGSELKSILQLKFINNSKTINYNSINEFLHLGYIPQPNTIWNNIYKFPSGSFATIKNTHFEIKSYWQPENFIENEIHSDYNKTKLILKEKIIKSVNYRLISDVPFGTFLSGGIDSSLVTAVAQSLTNEPVKTFSIGFKENKFNEAEHAKKVASFLKTDHHEFVVSQNDALEFVDDIVNVFDEPFIDSSAIPTMFVSKLAKKYVSMTLSGDGGDELFYGYGAYNWAKRLSNPIYFHLRKPISAGLSILSNRNQRAAKVFNAPCEKSIESHIFSQEQYLFSEKEIYNIVIQSNNNINLNYKFNHKRNLSKVEIQSLFDLKYYLKDDLLVKVDRASMKFSLETRVPLLDHNIVEYALNIPEEFKIKDGVQKYILKEILYDYIPREYFERPKWGFSIPLSFWLKNELSYLVERHLSRESIEKYGVLDYKIVEKLKNDYFSGKDYLYNRVWALIILQSFLSKH